MNRRAKETAVNLACTAMLTSARASINIAHAYRNECIASTAPYLADTLASTTPRRLEHDWQPNAVGALHRLFHCVHACLLVEVVRDVPALICGQLNLYLRAGDNKGVVYDRKCTRARMQTCERSNTSKISACYYPSTCKERLHCVKTAALSLDFSRSPCSPPPPPNTVAYLRTNP